MITEAVLVILGAYTIYMFTQDPVTKMAEKSAKNTVAKFEETRMTGIIKANTDLVVDPSGIVRTKDFTDHEKQTVQGKRQYPIETSRDKSSAVANIQRKNVQQDVERKELYGRAIKPNASITRPGESRDVGRIAASATNIVSDPRYKTAVYQMAQDF